MRPFRESGGVSTQISTNGGTAARWSGNGREMFYVAVDRRLMVVSIVSTKAGRLEAGAPVALFTLPPDADYEVARDGQRFLANAALSDEGPQPITVLLNRRDAAR
ncbi:MAG: hypothetical protein ACRD2A_11685 [Vicinamibacterales bacterium]